MPTIFISAGEASGELYGAQLASLLRQKLPQAELIGMGGEGKAEEEGEKQSETIHTKSSGHDDHFTWFEIWLWSGQGELPLRTNTVLSTCA